MEILRLLCVSLGVCLLSACANAADPAFSGTTTITVAENHAAGTILGSVTVSATPNKTTIVSQPFDGQFEVALNAGTTAVDIKMTQGFQLDYEKQKVITLTISASKGAPSATATVTINLTDVVEEFTSPIIGQCFQGTTFGPGSVLTTVAASKAGVTAAYSITSQSPNIGHLAMNPSNGVISVAPGKTIDGTVAPLYTVNVKLISSVPGTTTSTATVYLGFGCGSTGSGAPATMIGTVTLLMALLVAFLH